MIDIIVPIYNVDAETEDMTLECLRTFIETRKTDDRILVVDDHSPRPFKYGFDQIKTPKNLGNAGSWNWGIKHSSNDVILLSDNDIVPADWREQMLKALEKYDIVFPCIYNQREGKLIRHLAGEFFMFRRALVDEIGILDEGYGSYFEDTDFFMRAMNAGKTLGIAENTFVTHRSQGTFKRVWSDEKMRENFDRNKKRYEEKFGPNYPYLTNKL
mgnify:CR=1 FL=1